MKWNGASSHGEGSHFSRVAAGTWGIFWSYSGDGPSKLVFVQRCQDSCLVMTDTSGISSRLGRATGTLLEVRRETHGPIPVATGILGFLSIFKRTQGSPTFEALNSACLSMCQRDVRPPFVLKPVSGSFSRVSTGASHIPSSCDMKHEPAFKPQQRNQAFFRGRASWCPFHLRQQNHSPSQIPIAERSRLLRCLWKVGIPLESKPGNQLSSRNDLGYIELSSRCCAKFGVPLDLRRCSWGI